MPSVDNPPRTRVTDIALDVRGERQRAREREFIRDHVHRGAVTPVDCGGDNWAAILAAYHSTVLARSQAKTHTHTHTHTHIPSLPSSVFVPWLRITGAINSSRITLVLNQELVSVPGVSARLHPQHMSRPRLPVDPGYSFVRGVFVRVLDHRIPRLPRHNVFNRHLGSNLESQGAGAGCRMQDAGHGVGCTGVG